MTQERGREESVGKIDHEWTNEPVCPHCGHHEEDWWEFDSLKGDGSETEVDCASCEKPYRINMSVSYSFTTSKVSP